MRDANVLAARRGGGGARSRAAVADDAALPLGCPWGPDEDGWARSRSGDGVAKPMARRRHRLPSCCEAEMRRSKLSESIAMRARQQVEARRSWHRRVTLRSWACRNHEQDLRGQPARGHP
eukprot:363540-Chlamydomonas_euryale.AAC.7